MENKSFRKVSNREGFSLVNIGCKIDEVRIDGNLEVFQRDSEKV